MTNRYLLYTQDHEFIDGYDDYGQAELALVKCSDPGAYLHDTVNGEYIR